MDMEAHSLPWLVISLKRTSIFFHVEFPHILKGVEAKTVKQLGGNCFLRKLFVSRIVGITISITHLQVLNFILKTWLHSTMQFRETMHFSAMCDVCNVENRSSGVQILWDICTRFVCQLVPIGTRTTRQFNKGYLCMYMYVCMLFVLC